MGLLLFAFCNQMKAQLSLNIKHKIEGNEGITLLRHGPYNYQIGIEERKVSHAYYGKRRMAAITGDAKIQKIRELLGPEQEIYTDLSCECLSLWQVDNKYTIFEISDEARREQYTIHYHIIKE